MARVSRTRRAQAQSDGYHCARGPVSPVATSSNLHTRKRVCSQTKLCRANAAAATARGQSICWRASGRARPLRCQLSINLKSIKMPSAPWRRCLCAAYFLLSETTGRARNKPPPQLPSPAASASSARLRCQRQLNFVAASNLRLSLCAVGGGPASASAPAHARARARQARCSLSKCDRRKQMQANLVK